MPARLTQRAIDALSALPATQYVVWDTDVRGFGVRVSPAGAKAYVLKFRTAAGRARWATLGRVGVLSLDEARRNARAMLGDVAKGLDPLRARDAARGGLTVESVAARFLSSHVEARRKAATVRLYKLAINSHVIPKLGSIAIAELAPADVARVHHGLHATPYLANRVLAVLSKLVSWSEQHGYRAPGANPCRGIEAYREQSRRRYLTPAELKRLGVALRFAERRNRLPPSAIVAIRLLLLTGARVSEILSLQWRFLDLSAGSIHLPDSKTGRKTILLSPPAVAILDAWPRFAGSPYVFPGEGRGDRKGKHRVSLSDAWMWLRTRAKARDVRLHDLRHTFASVAVSNGQTLPMIGALLGHSQAATTQRYAHLMNDPLRAASDATAATIASAIAGKERK